ncbi:hypothetical protein [Pedobacter sp. BMA]
MTKNQFNALTSFCYNIGTAGFLGTTLLKKVNAKAPNEEISNATEPLG